MVHPRGRGGAFFKIKNVRRFAYFVSFIFLWHIQSVAKKMDPRSVTRVSIVGEIIIMYNWYVSGVGSGDGKDLLFEVIINGSVVFHLGCTQGRPGQVTKNNSWNNN